MSDHEERAHGILATAARYAETAFAVIAAGPSTYAKVDLGPRYSTPAEFLIITLTINGLASLGLHTAVASAVDESKTAEHVSSLSLAALGSIAVVLVWAFAAAWAARLSGRRIPRDVLWRVSCYTTAFTLLVIPLTSLWLASLELFLPDEDVSDLVRYLVPAIPIVGVSLVAYIRGVIRGFEGRRLPFLFFFVLFAIIVPICVRVAPTIPIIGEVIDENSRPSLNAASGDAIESLSIRRFGLENFGAHAAIGERERFQLLVEIRNLSQVTAHNVIVRLEGPFLRRPQSYVFYSIATCDGCGRDDVGHADLYWQSISLGFTPRRLTARMYRKYDYKHPLPLPNGQTVDALFSDAGLLLGDVAPQRDARLQIVVELEADLDTAAGYDYPDVHDYPNPRLLPEATADHPPQGLVMPPASSPKK